MKPAQIRLTFCCLLTATGLFSLRCSFLQIFPPASSEWKRVVKVSLTLGLVIYYVTGLTAYLSFRAATEGDILDNFEGTLASCVKIIMVVHLVVYIPSEVSTSTGPPKVGSRASMP